MPTYTYSCVNCDYTTTIMCKIDDRDNQRCEDCGYSLVRAIDRPGLVWSPTRNGGHST